MSIVQHHPERAKNVPAGYVLRPCIICDAGLVVPATDREPNTCRDCRTIERLNGLDPAELRAAVRRLDERQLSSFIYACDVLGQDDLLEAAVEEVTYRLDVLDQRQTDEQQDREQQQAEAELDPERWDGMS